MIFRFLLVPLLLFSTQVWAGVVEISAGFSYNRSNYSETNYSWNRRLGASIGYHLSERSQIELAFQDVMDRTKIEGYEDTTFFDKIYSANWVQAITGKNYPIQPYFKLGIGQLNRKASGNYFGGAARPPDLVDQVTGVLGAGMRIYLTKNFGLRMEGTSYLSGGAIGTWKDNFALNFGLSIYF
jgi:hypothetical protein